MVSMVGCDEMVEIPHVVTLQPCQAKVLVVGGSMAIGNFNRTNYYHGIGQNLDTRCFHENLDEVYEVTYSSRLENI